MVNEAVHHWSPDLPALIWIMSPFCLWVKGFCQVKKIKKSEKNSDVGESSRKTEFFFGNYVFFLFVFLLYMFQKKKCIGGGWGVTSHRALDYPVRLCHLIPMILPRECVVIGLHAFPRISKRWGVVQNVAVKAFPANTRRCPDVGQRWASVVDGGLALAQHRDIISCLLGYKCGL